MSTTELLIREIETLPQDCLDTALGLIRDLKKRNPAVPVPGKTPRRIGFMEGRISIPADFKTMGQEEIIALFEG